MLLGRARTKASQVTREIHEVQGSPSPSVEIRNVNKWYGAFQVIRDVSLTVETGGRLVIVGPSGSGKSTLIRCINRLEEHQSGKILVNGLELTDNPKHISKIRSQVGMVFQSFNLFPHLTILENCTLAPLSILKITLEEAQDTAMYFLERVRIAEQAHKYPAQLSGGQQQRAAIARSLCMRPKIMLFDEPTSALDPEMVREVLDTIMTLAADGMTLICVTHEMGFAREIANNIILMDQGQVIECAKPEDFFDRPQNSRTKQFLNQVLRR